MDGAQISGFGATRSECAVSGNDVLHRDRGNFSSPAKHFENGHIADPVPKSRPSLASHGHCLGQTGNAESASEFIHFFTPTLNYHNRIVFSRQKRRAPDDREGEGRACRFIAETGGRQAGAPIPVARRRDRGAYQKGHGAAPPRYARCEPTPGKVGGDTCIIPGLYLMLPDCAYAWRLRLLSQVPVRCGFFASTRCLRKKASTKRGGRDLMRTIADRWRPPVWTMLPTGGRP